MSMGKLRPTKGGVGSGWQAWYLSPSPPTGSMCNVNIDECAGSPCHNGGTCEDGIAGFTCRCPEGYHDPTCLSEVNECNSNPCIHGVCRDGLNGYGRLAWEVSARSLGQAQAGWMCAPMVLRSAPSIFPVSLLCVLIGQHQLKIYP